MNEVDEEYCSVCVQEKEWVECFDCGGDGFFEEWDSDWLEDVEETCGMCGGAGGWYECANVPHDKS